MTETAIEEKVEKNGAIHWSRAGQVQFIDGWAWGITTDLKPICLGRESDVRAALDNPKLQPSLNPVITQIFELERECLARQLGTEPSKQRSAKIPSKGKGKKKKKSFRGK